MVKIYEKFGTINWDELIDPSINVARNGFMVTKKQARGLNNVKESLCRCKCSIGVITKTNFNFKS